MSAPFGYARIWKGLSSLISRGSAISRRIRAMAALSIAVRMRVVPQPQAFGFDAVVEQPRTAGCKRVGDRLACVRWTVAEETAAASRAARFRAGRTGGARTRDQIVDGRRRHAGRQPLAVLPLGRNLPSDFLPVAALQRGTHRNRRVADPLEAVEHVTVAVGVPLGNLPVVRA